MKKTYSKNSRQGLPGGPNEMFEKVKNIIVSQRGQWDFPGMNTMVPTDDGRITMRGVPYPVYGQDETGYGQMMYPNQEYQFPGKNVLELPMAQKGLQKKLQPWEYLDKEGNLHTDIDLLPNDPQGSQKYAEELNWMRNWITNRQSQMQSAIKSYMSRQDEKHPVDALAREYIFSPLFGQPSAYGLSNDWGTTNQELGKSILKNAVNNVNTLKFKDSSKVNPESYLPAAYGSYTPNNHSIHFSGQYPGGDTKIHEIGHGTRLAKQKVFQDVIQHNIKNDPIYKSNYDNYHHSPEEIYSRIWEIRKGLNLKPTDKITKEILKKKLNENKNSEEYIDLFKHLKPDTIINLLNELVYQEPDFQLPMAQVGLQVPIQQPDALRVHMNINPNAEYMEKKKSDVLDLDNTLDYLVETRGGTRDLWGHMADTIGYHESGHTMNPLQMQNSGGPGRGIFQFEAPSLITAQNRYKRISDRLKLKPDPKILSAKSALELSSEQQYSLFLINLAESSAKLKDYADNKLPLVDLWLQGHKKIEKDENRGSFRTSVQKAKDKSIQKGYDSFKKLGGSLPKAQVGDEIFPGEGQYYNIPEYTYNYKRGFDDLPTPRYTGPLMNQRLIDEATQREYEQRRRAIEESVAAAREPLSTQRLARESAATGDKFSLQMNLGDPYNNPRLYDALGALDFINPGVMLGDMVTGLGSVPYNVQEGNYGAAAVGLGLPLATGALAAIGVKTPRQFVNNLVNPVAGIGDTPKQLPGSPVASSVDDVGKVIADTPHKAGFIDFKGALQKYPKGPVTQEEVAAYKNSSFYKKNTEEYLDYKSRYGDSWTLPNFAEEGLQEAITKGNRNNINRILYGGRNWRTSDYVIAGLVGTAYPGTAGIMGLAFSPPVVKNTILPKLGLTNKPASLSSRDTTIDLTNRNMDFAKVNEFKDGQIIIGGEFIETANNTVRKAKDWLNATDTYSDKEYPSKDIHSFYGIENGKFKVGKASDFNSDTEIVPRRFGAVNINKAVLNNNKMRLLDKKGNPIYQNTPNTGKFILYSPSTKKAEFKYINSGKTGVNAVNKFLKENKDAEYIHLDNGRYEFYGINNEGLTNYDYESYYHQDLERKGTPGYNLILKKLGGSLPTAEDPVLNFIQRQSPRFSKSKK